MRCSALLVAAAFVLDASAQGRYATPDGPGVLRLSEIIGIEVLTPEGRRLGRITDVYFDRASGEIEEIAVGTARYPVSALVSGDAPGHVVLEQPSASVGATGARSLVPLSTEALVIDLLQRRVRPAR